MKRTRLVVLVTIVSACLIGAAAQIVLGQNTHEPAPQAMPAALPPPALPALPVPGAPGSDATPHAPSLTAPAVQDAPALPAADAPQVGGDIVPTKLDNPPESSFDTANPTGKQEPAVSIEWIGPPQAKLGQPVTYQIIAKNISAGAVHNVAVRYPVPPGVGVQASEPRASNEGNALRWEIGS